MNLTVPLDEMTVEDKIRTMEIIWNDLCKNVADISSPDWHKDILDNRETNLNNGTDKFIDWETSKKNINEAIK